MKNILKLTAVFLTATVPMLTALLGGGCLLIYLLQGVTPGYGLVILSGLGAFVVALLCFVGIVLGIDLAERLNDKLDY